MARFGIKCALSFLVVLPYGSIAETLKSERHSHVAPHMVRREPETSLHVNGRGALQTVSGRPEKLHSKTLVTEPTAEIDATSMKTQELTKLKEQFCDYDFPLGKPDSIECVAANHNHTIILQESMCITAAAEAGAVTDGVNGTFMIDYDHRNGHPKGCFKLSSTEITSGSQQHLLCPAGKVCYYFNPIGQDPNGTIAGTPVCSRPLYRNSTAANTEGGCPTDYQVIHNENECYNSANCLGMAPSAYFRTGVYNASVRCDHPVGCYVDLDNGGEVHFNAASKMDAECKATSRPVRGLLLCNVSATVKWHGETQAGAGGGSTTAAPA